MSASYGRVAVLMGGWSSERDISLLSGQCVLNALQDAGVDAFAFDVTTESVRTIAATEMDRGFIILHGKGGEDGTIQALLDALSVPFTGSGVLAAALSMNKLMAKRIWRSLNIPTPDFLLVKGQEDFASVEERLQLPCFIKPVDEGSSIGVSKVGDPSQLQEAWQTAASTGSRVLAEQCIDGEEYAVGFVQDQFLPPVRLEVTREFYDYEAKYGAQSGTCYHCPCGLSDDEVSRLQALCHQACQALDVQGWGRVDVMRDAQGDFYILEVNTVPGMTERSLVPMAAQEHGMNFQELTIAILETAQ